MLLRDFADQVPRWAQRARTPTSTRSDGRVVVGEQQATRVSAGEQQRRAAAQVSRNSASPRTKPRSHTRRPQRAVGRFRHLTLRGCEVTSLVSPHDGRNSARCSLQLLPLRRSSPQPRASSGSATDLVCLVPVKDFQKPLIFHFFVTRRAGINRLMHRLGRTTPGRIRGGAYYAEHAATQLEAHQ